MDSQEFYDDLMNDVRTRAEIDNDFTQSAFLQETTERLVEAEEVGDLTPVNFTGTGIRGRRLTVSAYDEDASDDSIALAVVHFEPGAYIETLSEAEARRQFAALKFYIEESLSGSFQGGGREESSAEYDLAEKIRKRARGVTRYRLYLLTNKALSGRAKDLPSERVDEIPVEYHVWDIERFRRVFESALGRDELTIDLREWAPAGVPALKALATREDTTTYLCVLPGRIIADLYGRYGGRLLQSNVRSYLSNVGKVNRGIRETVQSKPGLFLAYNNGITATATAVEVNGSAIIKITDLQIVNGGQTTASLFYVGRDRKNLTKIDEVYVQAKLVVVSPEVAERLVPNISRFANSQNRVSEADFFSNSPFHIRIEELSRRILTPPRPGSAFQSKWFYERTRGQYASERSKLGKRAQDQFVATYPKSQVIKKEDAAKYIMSWERAPHKVSAGAQKNFTAFADKVAKEWESSSDSFNDSYFKDLVALAILYNTIRRTIAKQSWYEQGYLAQIVTYTISKVSDVVAKAYKGKFNFDAVWQQQAVSDATMNFALDVAQQVLRVLTWSGRSKANVTEWAKDEECWKRVQDFSIVLPEDLVSELVSGIAVRSAKKEARVQRQIDDGIEAQAAVLRISRDEWLGIKNFAGDRGLLGPTDAGILEIVTRQSPGLPSERQALRLLDLQQRAIANGYERERE